LRQNSWPPSQLKWSKSLFEEYSMLV